MTHEKISPYLRDKFYINVIMKNLFPSLMFVYVISVYILLFFTPSRFGEIFEFVDNNQGERFLKGKSNPKQNYVE
jgi:hypothetical protein